jgi:hypothetical protein
MSDNTGSRVSTEYIRLKQHKANIPPDGYISFPDFEKFCQNQNPYGQQERSDVKT